MRRPIHHSKYKVLKSPSLYLLMLGPVTMTILLCQPSPPLSSLPTCFLNINLVLDTITSPGFMSPIMVFPQTSPFILIIIPFHKPSSIFPSSLPYFTLIPFIFALILSYLYHTHSLQPTFYLHPSSHCS